MFIPLLQTGYVPSHLHGHYLHYNPYWLQQSYFYKPISHQHPNVLNSHNYFQPGLHYLPKVENAQLNKQKKLNTQKQHQQDYHLHHGFPIGQGSGQFPDYYNSTY